MRIRKRPILLSNPSDISPRPLQTISHIPPPLTFHCFPLLSGNPQPQPTRPTFPEFAVDQIRHSPDPKGFSAVQEEHGSLAGLDQETFFAKSKGVTIRPPADNESPKLLESEIQENDSEALSVPWDCRPVCMSVNQILGVRRKRELSDKPRPQQGLDTMKVSRRKIFNVPSESESERRKALETFQIEVGHSIRNDTDQPFEREKINGLHEHIPGLRADYKGKRTSRQRRRCGGLSLTEHFNRISSGWETRGTFFPVLYHVIAEAGDEGLTVSEAVRRLVEKGYSNLFQIDGLPRSVQVGRALRSNACVMEVEDGKFVVLTRSHTEKTPLLEEEEEEEEEGVRTLDHSELENAVPMNGRDQVEVSGKRCNRKDGRGWQCHKRCKMGASYCEYHGVKIKANHERSAKKLMYRKMSKKVDGWSRMSAITTNTTRTTTIATARTSSKTNNMGSKNTKSKEDVSNNNMDNEESRSDRNWRLAASSSSSSAAATSGATVAASEGGEGNGGGGGAKSCGVWRWKGQRKRVKARSLKWIEERCVGCCCCCCCMLNSDPKEWRSDLFV